jgi:predicted aminopeptidase
MVNLRACVDRWVRLRWLVVALAGIALPGCYLLQAATGQFELMMKREPIDRLLADPATTDALRQRLEYVRRARMFAVDELALPDNDSYRSYVALDRPFVVWNVFATERFSVDPRTWCFPIAGCVVYRGYFDRGAAEAYARRLRLEGDDAIVAGVAAYSTLGHFADPVLSSMMRFSDAELAATLFHELAHQIVYVPGDARFNEAFATVVEEEGLGRWLAARGESDAIESWREARARDRQFRDLLLQTRAQLQSLYASAVSEAVMWQRKQQIFGDLKFRYARLRGHWGGYRGYDAWFDQALNNAHLVPIMTYYDCVPGFRRLLAETGDDFQSFYAAVQERSTLAPETRLAGLCAQAATLTAR